MPTRPKSSVVQPTEEGCVSDRFYLNLQTIVGGLSQCLIVYISNDVMLAGFECFASKDLHRLDFD